jgi:hypothetical protein
VEDNVEESLWRINATLCEVATEVVPSGWERLEIDSRLEGKV